MVACVYKNLGGSFGEFIEGIHFWPRRGYLTEKAVCGAEACETRRTYSVFSRPPLFCGGPLESRICAGGLALRLAQCPIKLRGRAYVTVIADELAFWFTEAAYANPTLKSSPQFALRF
jgi:hypothetical protein